jgi:hypothetical protein
VVQLFCLIDASIVSESYVSPLMTFYSSHYRWKHRDWRWSASQGQTKDGGSSEHDHEGEGSRRAKRRVARLIQRARGTKVDGCNVIISAVEKPRAETPQKGRRGCEIVHRWFSRWMRTAGKVCTSVPQYYLHSVPCQRTLETAHSIGCRVRGPGGVFFSFLGRIADEATME